jgi:hypothetical protein
MPAFWWMYNMYALARNTWKFQTRDQRKTRTQKIEFDSLAPDTAEEMFRAMRLLEIWTAKAHLRAEPQSPQGRTDDELADLGRTLLTEKNDRTAAMEVLGENMECSHRKVLLLKPRQAYHAYREMLHYYAVKNLLEYLEAHPKANLSAMNKALAGPRESHWVNLGGQLVTEPDFTKLLAEIKSGKLKDWNTIHAAYDHLWEAYPLTKQRHAWATLRDLLGESEKLTPKSWEKALDEAARIQNFICEQVYLSRKKDYDNPFRQATFANTEEMTAVIGTIEDNSFIKQTRKDTEAFLKRLKAARKRG